MMCPVFFEKSINNEERYLCDEVVVDYFIIKNIDSDNPYLVEKNIRSLVGEESLNRSKFNRYYSKRIVNFKCKDFSYKLDLVAQFRSHFDEICQFSKEDLINRISSFLDKTFFNVSDVLPYIYAFDKLTYNRRTVYYEACYLNMLINVDDYNSQMDEAVFEIQQTYLNIPIKQLLHDATLCELLFANNINLIQDLKTISINALVCLASLNFNEVLKSLNYLKYDYSCNLRENISSLFANLDERMFTIISQRYGFNGKERTLEQIGKDYNLTRERIRQIEKKASETIIPHAGLINCQLLSLFKHLAGDGGKYITCENLLNYFQDNNLYNCVLYILQNCDLPIKYNENLQIIYNKEIATPEEFANEIIDIFGDMVDKDIVDSFDECERRVITKYYRLHKNSIYLRKGLQGSDVICSVIDETFPDGYKIDDDENYKKLCNALIEKYGDDFELSSKRAFDGIIGRKNYCLIDRGLYKNRNLCQTLPEDLLNEIIDFTSEQCPVCNYITIYEKYKDQLNLLGIDNYYYLKGVLDPYLPEEFVTHRNYIQTSDEKITSYEAILKYINSFDFIFGIDDLKTKFAGVKEYTFFNVIYAEVAKSGLVWLSNKRFVYLDKLNIEEETIKQLKETIENLFVTLNEETISAKKVYARLALTNKELMAKLKVCEDTFGLFSLIRALFPNDYGYNRPLISKDCNIQISSINLIYNYANKLESFNSKIINSYVNKMNIRGLYSYLIFMENMSDDFVQINIDSMIKKEKMVLSEQNLNEIKKLVYLMINRYGLIDTRDFNGYIMLPRINYQWNKYLLVGIVRTYLSEEFEIENTDTAYDQTEFIIRRIK